MSKREEIAEDRQHVSLIVSEGGKKKRGRKRERAKQDFLGKHTSSAATHKASGFLCVITFNQSV